MLDLAILGLLHDQELHGYELKKRLAELLGPLSSVSFGSLYPALARLERAGAVKAVEARTGPAEAPVPMTGSLGGELAAFRARRSTLRPGGRSRKVYGITDRGRRLFEELLAEDPADDERSFCLRLSFAAHLAPAARVGLLERRRGQLAERLARGRRSLRSGPARDRYVRLLAEHGAETVEREIAWLDRLIAEERREAEADHHHPTGAAEAPVATQEGTTTR